MIINLNHQIVENYYEEIHSKFANYFGFNYSRIIPRKFVNYLQDFNFENYLVIILHNYFHIKYQLGFIPSKFANFQDKVLYFRQIEDIFCFNNF